MDAQTLALLADGAFTTVTEASGHLALREPRIAAGQLNRGRFGYRRMEAMREQGTFLEIKCLCNSAGDNVEGKGRQGRTRCLAIERVDGVRPLKTRVPLRSTRLFKARHLPWGKARHLVWVGEAVSGPEKSGVAQRSRSFLWPDTASPEPRQATEFPLRCPPARI